MSHGRPILFWLILGVQLAVPIVRLGAEKPARFGWHMFADVRPQPAFEIHRAAGPPDTVALEEALVHPRQEIDFGAVVPPLLCDEPGAERVTVLLGVPPQPTSTHECD